MEALGDVAGFSALTCEAVKKEVANSVAASDVDINFLALFKFFFFNLIHLPSKIVFLLQESMDCSHIQENFIFFLKIEAFLFINSFSI